jgi:hypothetical protein
MIILLRVLGSRSERGIKPEGYMKIFIRNVLAWLRGRVKKCENPVAEVPPPPKPSVKVQRPLKKVKPKGKK